MKWMKKNGRSAVSRYLTMILALTLLSTTVLAGCGQETAEDTKVISENIRESEAESAPEKESETEEKEEVAEKPEETVPEEKETVTDAEVVEVSNAEDEVAAYVKKGNGLVNGNFADGLDGYEVYSFLEDNISYTTDSKDGFTMEIADTGDEAWHVQLKQAGIALTKGSWYRLSLKAKASRSRVITCTMQRDGNADDVWTAYSPESRLELTKSWKTYTVLFRMQDETDKNAIFNLSMGTVDGKKIAKNHSVSVTGIKLEKLDDNWIDATRKDGNLIANGDFSYGNVMWEASVVDPAKSDVSFDNNKVTFDMKSVGDSDWHLQLKQSGIKVTDNQGYFISFKATSNVYRYIKIGVMDQNYVNWYGGGDVYLIGDGEEHTYGVSIYNQISWDDNAQIMISMGKIEGLGSAAGKVELYDFNMTKSAYVPYYGQTTIAGTKPMGPQHVELNTQMLASTDFSAGSSWDHYFAEAAAVSQEIVGGKTVLKITNPGVNDYDVQYKQSGLTLEKGCTYEFELDAVSSPARMIKVGFLRENPAVAGGWEWFGGGDISLTEDTSLSAKNVLGKVLNTVCTAIAPGKYTNELFGIAAKTSTKHKISFTMTGETIYDGVMTISMGKIDDTTPVSSTITLSSCSLKKIEEAAAEKPEESGEKLPEGVFARVNATDKKVSDEYGEKWVVKIEAPAYDVSKFEHKTVKITGDLESDGTFSALLGACYYAPGNEWSWVDSGAKEGSKVSFSVVAKDFHGGAQFQIMSMTGTYVDVKNLKVEEYVEEEKPEESEETGEKLPEGVFARVNATDKKVSDEYGEKWVVKIEAPAYDVSKFEHKTVKITGDLESDGTFSALLGACYYAPGNEWSWVDSGAKEGSKVSFSVVAKYFHGGAQFQIMSMTGRYVDVKNLKVEEYVEEEKPEDSGETGNAKPETDPNNMLQNGIFDGNAGWSTYVHTTDGAAADFSFENYAVKVDIANLGEADWNVQLKQAGLTFEQNAKYDVKFDIVSNVDRTVKLALMSGESDWYGGDDIVLKANELRTYTQTFTIEKATTTQGVLQFSMGKVGEETSTGSITIKNVVMKKVVADPNEQQPTSPEKLEDGTIRFHNTDAKNDQGLLIYNLDFTSISEPVGKKIKVTATMESDGNFTGQIGGCTTQTPAWVGDYKADIKKADFDVTFDTYTDAGQIQISNMTGTYVDVKNIKYEELGTSSNPSPTPEPEPLNSVISNGNFTNNGEGWQMTGKTEGTSVTYNNGAAVINIANAGTNPWSVQIQQPNVSIIPNGKYVLTFTAKADKEKKIGMGLTGGPSSYISYYSKEFTLTTAEQEYTDYFVVTGDPSQDTISFQMNLGKVGEIAETDSAEVTIKDVKLTFLGEVILGNDTLNVGNEIFLNKTATGTASFANGKLTVGITNPGTEEWHIQLKKSGITLEQGKSYAICCNVSSTAARKIKMACMTPEYAWYGGGTVEIGAGKYIYSKFTVSEATANNIDFVISMGSPVDDVVQSGSTIEIWNFELLKLD